VIFTFNGVNYTIPDLGGNADSTGTGVYEVGTFNLSGPVSFKGTHKYANTFTGLWYSDPYSKVGSGHAMESVSIASVVLEEIVTPPTCTMSAVPSTITAGNTSNLRWTSTNATSAVINQGIGNVAVNGNRNVSPFQTTTYTGTFTGPGGTVNCQTTVTVTIPQMPTCTMTVNPANITTGQSATLSWTSVNATSAVINQGIGNVAVNGSRSVSPTQTTTYTGTFTGAGGVVTCQKTLTVNNVPPPQLPTCAMSAVPQTISVGDTSNLRWTSTNATSAVINQGIGTVAVDGNRNVSPTQTTTYTGTFTGSGGSVVCQTTIIVTSTHPAPTCTMTVTPDSIVNGGNATLAWNSTNATSASINQGIGTVAVDGSRVVSPNQTTTYTGTFTGSGGVVTCSAMLTVSGTGGPSINITKNDNDNGDDTQAVVSGGTATFTVVVTNNGTRDLIDVVVTDALAPNCNRTESQTAGLYPGLVFDPGESFTYTCTDTDITSAYTNTIRVDADEIGTFSIVNDTDTSNVTITGSGNTPTCSMSFTPSSINVGDRSTLAWNSTNVTTAVIDNGVGSVNPNGSTDIFRTSSATYTGTFTGPGGVVTCQANITVGGGGGGGTNTPRITLSSGSGVTEPGFIYLSQIPYTGIPQFLMTMMGFVFRFAFFGGLLFALYKIK
jgi:uncharacterized repeat protein (TIGR01451 family)